MSSIFGTGYSSFTGNGSPDSNTVVIYHSTLEPNFSEKISKMETSPVSTTGKRSFKTKGRHATFTVLVHLHKYDRATKPSADAWTQSSSLMAAKLITYLHHDVIFYPFTTPGYGITTCHLTEIKFDFLRKIGAKYDICILTFKTNQVYDLSNLIDGGL